MLIIDFEKGEKVVLDKFSKGTIPERGEFLDIGGSKAGIYWDDTIKLYHAAIGANGNAYCSTSDKKLIKVNPEISEYLRNILVEHGAKTC